MLQMQKRKSMEKDTEKVRENIWENLKTRNAAHMFQYATTFKFQAPPMQKEG